MISRFTKEYYINQLKDMALQAGPYKIHITLDDMNPDAWTEERLDSFGIAMNQVHTPQLEAIQDLIKALAAGGYSAAPKDLNQGGPLVIIPLPFLEINWTIPKK